MNFRCKLSIFPKKKSQLENWYYISFLGLSQTEWLKTTENFFIKVLRSRNTKSRWHQGHTPFESFREEFFMPLPHSGGPRHSLACGSITPISASFLYGFLIYVSSQCVLSSSYKDICPWIRGPTYFGMTFLKLITSAKIFPNKVIFWSSKWIWIPAVVGWNTLLNPLQREITLNL